MGILGTSSSGTQVCSVLVLALHKVHRGQRLESLEGHQEENWAPAVWQRWCSMASTDFSKRQWSKKMQPLSYYFLYGCPWHCFKEPLGGWLGLIKLFLWCEGGWGFAATSLRSSCALTLTLERSQKHHPGALVERQTQKFRENEKKKKSVLSLSLLHSW